MAEEKIDLSTYPEGYEEVLKLLDFLPDDRAVKDGYMAGLMAILMGA